MIARHSWILANEGETLLSLEGVRKFDVIRNHVSPSIGSQGPAWRIDMIYNDGTTETIGYDSSKEECIALIGRLWKALQEHDLVFLEVR